MERKNNVINNQQRVTMPGILPGVNPVDLTPITCQCGSTRFIELTEIRGASRFQTQHGQPMLVTFKVGYGCTKCGAINNFSHTPDGKVVEKKEEEVKKEDNNTLGVNVNDSTKANDKVGG